MHGEVNMSLSIIWNEATFVLMNRFENNLVNKKNVQLYNNTIQINQLKINFVMIFVIKLSSKPYWKF
jgi:hypothetical protein